MIHHDSSLRFARVPMLLAALFALSLLAMPALANSHAPSTNEANEANGWAHVTVVDDDTPGQITLEFVSTRNFQSCFEYRTDGDTSQQTAEVHPYNPGADDGLYPFECIENETFQITLEADEYVEVRMLFGAESDERFEWTRFDVLPVPDAETKDDCMDGGWAEYGFANQGQCIRFVNGAGDSR